MRPLCVVLSVVTSAGVLAQERSALPQYRAGVELIQLDVAVLDGKRQPVRGLSPADFIVLDNGVETPIRAFSPVELAERAPLTDAVWAREIAPDIATNQTAAQEGRLVVILLDRSIGPEQPTVVARRVAMAVVGQLGPHDLASVVSTSNGAVQMLTSDPARLARAINASGLSTDVTVDTRLIEEERLRSMGLPLNSALSDGRCLCGLCVLETITRVADALQGASHRHKVLFFIGSNIALQSANSIVALQTPGGDVGGAGADVGCESRLKDARGAMLSAVDRAHLTVPSIDPQGLVNVGPQTRASSANGFDRPGRPSAAATRLWQQQTETTDRLTSQQALRLLPDRTGGRTLVGGTTLKRPCVRSSKRVRPTIFSE